MGWNPFRRKPKAPDLRSMWLTEDVPGAPTLDGLHAVVIDYAREDGGVTLCCGADGSVSLLNFDGGGEIGLGENPGSAEAGRQMMRTVAGHRAHMRPVVDLRRPTPDRFAFMARSSAAILRVDAAEAELSDPAHSLHPLFVAFHAVITQIREAGPTDILLQADGGLSVRDPRHPSPTWLTLEQLREVLDSCKERGATVRMHRPPSPSPAAQVVLDVVDSQGVPVGDLPREDDLPEGVTSLHVACATPRVEIVQDLVQRGANLEALDEDKYTPLLVACNHGSADVVAVLVSAGANVQALDIDGNSALMFAAQSKDATKVEILLAAGANVNHRGQGNLTALGIAAQYPDNPAIAPLLRAGATK